MTISTNALRVMADALAVHPTVLQTARVTPCIASKAIKGLHFKTENFQNTGSFKLRGAVSKLSTLSPETPVIAASSGNHGIACSLAAEKTGHKLTVVCPEDVSKKKLKIIESFGTKTILHPGDSGAAELHARELAAEGGYVYVSPYNDPAILAGQATVGLELIEQLPRIDNLFVSMGGGGLVSGVGSVIKSVSPKTKIFGVSAINSMAFAESIKAGKVVDFDHLTTLADGCAGGVDDDALTLPIASELVDEIVCCSEEQIENSLRHLAWSENMVVEGAAAMALAAFLEDSKRFEGQVNVVILCGGNFDSDIIRPVIGAQA